jgi:tetratricopeptide (TPR) repeat protein
MPQKTNFDLESAHRYFSAECFNRAWDLIDKPIRTAEDDERMLLLSLASLWHWTQRSDCTQTNLSVGYWQASRIYAIIGQLENARKYGLLCLKTSQGEGIEPFYLGYAYEALGRTEMVAGNREKMADYLQKAFQVSEGISDPEEKQQLLKDLNTIR